MTSVSFQSRPPAHNKKTAQPSVKASPILSPLRDMLVHARANGYAVGGFNFCNAETAQAVIDTARELRSPALLISAPSELRHLGLRRAAELVRLAATGADVPVCLHLDHANNAADACEGVDAGFSSVMIDGSARPFDENVALTRQVVDYAHARGISVEGELGALGANKDAQHEGVGDASLTDPELAARFVELTGVDALAISIGNAHGFYAALPQFDFDRLAAIRSRVDIPLVLHGGSGTPPEQLRRAIGLGIAKVNVASEIGRAFTETFIAAMGRGGVWWAHGLQEAVKAIPPVIARWIRQLGSEGRA